MPDEAWYRKPIGRPLCSDACPMTPNRILQIARGRGYFEVSWRYRDDQLRRACSLLAQDGKLKRVKSRPGSSVYVPREPPPADRPMQAGIGGIFD
jgi:hypothetical protein